jgi:prevent-host-death family protein
MKTVTIRELHTRTGALVREAYQHGEIRITDNGRVVAKILPEAEAPKVPYFARRKFISESVRKLIETGQLGSGGTDSTLAISEDREDRV